jgi:hypothetical protein
MTRVRRSQLILSDVMGKRRKRKKASEKGKSHIMLEAKTWNINLISLIESIIPDKSQIQFPFCRKTTEQQHF